MTINKPPFPTDVFDDVITSISCITITDIDDIEGYSSYGLKYITPSCTLGQLNYTYVSRDSQTSCLLVPAFIINKHIQPSECVTQYISAT